MRLQRVVKRILFSFSFLLLNPFSSFSQKIPDWVLTAPSSADYYNGIGSANSGNRSEDYQVALEKAKANLAADISVQITMDRETKVFFSNEEQSEKKSSGIKKTSQTQDAKESIQVEEKILQQVQAFLKDVEIAKTWYDKKEGYWIYLRLKKSLYEQNRQKEMAKIRSRIYQILALPQGQKEDTLYFQFGRILKAYQVLSDSFFADEVSGRINGEEGALCDLLESNARNLLQSLRFEIDQPKSLRWGELFPLNCQLESDFAYAGKWRVNLFKREGGALSPLLFQFQLSSQGKIEKQIELEVLKQVGEQYLVFQLDLSEFETFLPLFNPPLLIPSAEIEFSFEVPLVGLKVLHSESALKKDLSSSVAALLIKKGIPFHFDIKNEQPAQLLFELDFTELPLYMEGQPLMVRGKLIITFQKGGKELFAYEILSAKASGTTFAHAKQNCWRALQQNLQKDENFENKLISIVQ